MMGRVERIAEVMPLEIDSPLRLLYGPHVFDSFVGDDYAAVDITAALWRHFKRNGYDRVLFYSSLHWLYFLDAESAPNTPQAVGAPGPLGNLEITAAPAATPRPRSDAVAFEHIEAFMAEAGRRTAFVMLDAENVLLQGDASRHLASLLHNWSGPNGHGRICVLLFSSLAPKALDHWVLGQPVLNALIASRNGQVVRRVPGPGRQECARIVSMARLVDGLEVDWSQDEALIRLMAAEDVPARSWLDRLSRAAAAGQVFDAATARRRRWFASMSEDMRSPWQQLDDFVGLDTLKAHLRRLRAAMELRRQEQAAGAAGSELPVLHMMFTGNPGTGKTTAARILGEILRDMDVLARGHLVSARASDLIAGYIGQTYGKTEQLVDSALDGVLFIDEAYQLLPSHANAFAKEALETLMTRMENDRARLCVILAGYPKEMEELWRVNPGMPRRIPPQNIIDFGDYGPDVLQEIARRMTAKLGRTLSPAAEVAMRQVIDSLHATRDATFGNAGEMRNLVEGLVSNRDARVVEARLPMDSPVEPADLPPSYRHHLAPQGDHLAQAMAELDSLLGLAPVKAFVRQQVNVLRLEQAQAGMSSVRPAELRHMIFTGNPGTGKTTVAGLMGRVFKSLGVLKRGHVVSVTDRDFTAGPVNEIAATTQARVREAMDGVLFIDEAYGLADNPYGHLAIPELLTAMEAHRDRLVVIAAGYTAPMERFLGLNPGLRGRLPFRVEFPDYTAEELALITQTLAQGKGYTLTEGAVAGLGAYYAGLLRRRPADFDNARHAGQVFARMKQNLASRLFGEGGSNPTDDTFRFEAADVPSVPNVRSAAR